MKILIDNINNYNEEDFNQFKFNLDIFNKQKYSKIIKEKRKMQFLLGLHLLEVGLKKYYNLDIHEIKFGMSKYGKPFIKYKNIFFNISHSYDLVVCVFDDKPIGVDVEKIRKVNINIIREFATANESKYILQDNTKKEERIFIIYTLKEAYFKMLGSNLNNIKNIEFNVENNIVYSSIKNINLSIIRNYKDYIISICQKTS